jgi:hypothetical protein
LKKIRLKLDKLPNKTHNLKEGFKYALSQLPKKPKPKPIKLKPIPDISDILNVPKYQKYRIKPQFKEILKIGDISDPDVHFNPGVYKKWSIPYYRKQVGQVFTKYVDYYFKNAVKHMNSQPIPTDDELMKVSQFIWKFDSPNNFKTYFDEGGVKSSTHFLWYLIERISNDDWKIIMKIAYNDGKNSNNKLFKKAVRFWNQHEEDRSQRLQDQKEEENIKWANRSEGN